MNKLTIDKRVQIINLLVEGMSLRATPRVANVSINTVTKLLVDVSKACQEFHDETVHSLITKRVQCDEIWSFVYAKGKNVPNGMEESVGDKTLRVTPAMETGLVKIPMEIEDIVRLID